MHAVDLQLKKTFHSIFLHIVMKTMSPVLFVAFYITVAHIKLMICIPCTQACCYCLRSDISVKHLTCTVKYTSNGSF